MSVTGFVSSTRSLFLLSRLLGLAPWSTDDKHFRVRRRDMVYTLLVVVNLFIWLMYIVSWRVLNEYVNASITFIVPQLAALLVSSVTTLVSQVVPVTYGADTIVKIVYLIADVDRRLNTHYGTAKRVVSLQVLVLLTLVGLLYGYDMWIWLYKKGDNYVIFRGICYLINAVMILQYMCFSELLVHRFGILNRKLDQLCTSNDAVSKLFSTHRVTPASSHSNLRSDVLIRGYRQLHYDLLNIASMLNVFYGLQCLMVFATVFIMVVKGLYFLLTTLNNPTVTKVDTTFNVHAAVIVLLWALFHALELLGMTTCCHLASARANATARVVQKLLLASPLGTSMELVAFSHQLLQTKLKFTACGFFFVDLHVLVVIAGAVMTYTIILNQALY